MMITIHGFPAKTKYADVKILIKQECKLEDFMLGNMLPDTDGTKKVKIGLTDDNEGYLVMKCLDGYRMGGNFVLKTIPVGKSAPNPPPQNTFDSRPTFSANPQRSDYPNPSRNDYQSRGDYQGPPSNSYGNRAPGPHGSGGPAHGTSAPHHGPQSSMNAGRQAQWTPNNTGPWANNPPIATQTQQNYNYQSQQNIAPFGQQPHPTHNQRPGPDIRPFPQSRPNQEPGFGFQPKTNTVPDHGPSRQLRNIETVETSGNHPPIHGRYPQPSQQYQQNKPVTIMKENFQGPTSFNINHPGGSGPHYQEPGPQPWQHQGQQPKPQHFSKPSPITYEKPPYEDRKYPPTDREMPTTHKRPETYKEYEKIGRGYSPGRPHALRSSPIERRVSPSGRRMSPPVRRVSPSGRRMSPSGRRVSPSGRRVSPPGRRVSPSGRRISPPGRRISPSGRRISPPGRRVSPPGRRISPSGRRISPSGRRDSPSGRRLSPSGRLISPSVRHMGVRRESPTQKRPSPGRRPASPHRRPSPSRRESPTRHMRYSPGRHNPDKPIDKYGHDGKPKQVRPAYEPSSQASKQAIYSGGYRPNVHDNVQYPVPGSRQVEPHRSPWQRDRDEYINNPEEERRGTPRAEIPRDRNPDKIVEASRQPPVRKSRSPVRRERSPVRDRFKRHSPSPRSPRRSWAFEKRRSPDMSEAPPPPVWPGQKREEGRPDPEYRYSRPNFPDREQIEPPLHRSTFQKAEVHVPKWERAVDEERSRRPEDEERRFHKSSRDMEREPHLSHSERYPREPKFSPREEFDVERRVDYRRPNEQPTKAYIHREEPRRREEDRRHVEERRREESPRREIRDKLLKTDTIDKDFEDIYNRALQFKQKAEELRRSANRRSDSEEVRSHRGEREREKDRYERSYREEQPPRQDYRRDDYKEQHKSEEDSRPKRFTLSPSLKAKREKVIEDITSKIMQRHPDFDQLKGEQRQRMITELNLAVARIVFDMFGHQDVSFIEIVVKYQAKYSIKDEEKILQDVVSSLPSQFRHIKRHASDSCDVPAKMSRPSSSPGIKQGRRPATVRVNPKPVREEPKTSQHNLTQRTNKTVQKNSTSEAKSVNESREDRKRNPSPPPPPVEPTADGYYELNPLMTKMVETELQDIMIKIWQVLPDNPTDIAEKLAVDKFRNKAGDDLRNVLGLNITKRLLNVHNPLYVKIQFTGKPEKVHLSAFLKKYNFNAFKRIENNVNTFAAQVRTIADFDRICSAKDIRCGNIKVTVNPCYRFTKCPSNLRTNFNDNDENSENTDSKEKDVEMKEFIETEDKQNDDKSTDNNTKVTPQVTKVEEKVEPIIKEQPKLVVDGKDAKADVKVIKKEKVVDTDKQEKTEKQKPVEVFKQAKPVEQKPTQIENVEMNSEKTTTDKQTKNLDSNKTGDTNNVKDIAAKKIESQSQTEKSVKTPVAKGNQKATKTAVPAKQNVEKKSQKVENDFDELDDHDILALMSEGIVLDECSGSEDE